MKPQPDRSTQEVLAGLVERVTFHNAENGFSVLRAKVRGQRDLVTVVGHAAAISAGEWITASGEWVNDRTHGQQFKAKFLKTSAPTSIDGIEKYLGSGMIRGIGPVYAKKLVGAFGEKVLDTIEAAPERLREVAGIGPVRAKRITDAWAEQKAVREIMAFADGVNLRFDGAAPWKLVKEGKAGEAAKVCSECLEAFKVMTACLKPVLPQLAHRLAMSLAQVSIGDPVLVGPGLYLGPLYDRCPCPKLRGYLAVQVNPGACPVTSP